MVRSVRIRGVAFGIAVLIVAHCFLEGRSPAYSQGVSEEAKAVLKERGRPGTRPESGGSGEWRENSGQWAVTHGQ